MGKIYPTLSPDLRAWMAEQPLFFVATAPQEGWINCSPKGLDTLRVLGEREVVYLDLTGSGVETIAHLQENGRILLMFCAFGGKPRILRIHGRGTVYLPNTDRYQAWLPLFPDYPGKRSIIHIAAERIADSCGYGVPQFEGVQQRDTLLQWATQKGEGGLAAYRNTRNAESIQQLPALLPENLVSPPPS